MNDDALLAQVGRTVWGSSWQTPMAEALKQSPGALNDWMSGRSRVPAEVWKALREAARLHMLKIADLDPRIVQAYDEAVARASARR
ncbi:MAG: hypothetical protein ACOY4R_26760 [Pseudomonadota bacterium]